MEIWCIVHQRKMIGKNTLVKRSLKFKIKLSTFSVFEIPQMSSIRFAKAMLEALKKTKNNLSHMWP
jgi:hypothetical protein